MSDREAIGEGRAGADLLSREGQGALRGDDFEDAPNPFQIAARLGAGIVWEEA